MPPAPLILDKHIPVPPECADEAALLAYLELGPNELKKISRYSCVMYHVLSITKKPEKLHLISAPDQSLDILQNKLISLLDKIYQVCNPVHGFVPVRMVEGRS